MPFIETAIPDVKIFEPRVFEDHRGYFFESFNHRVFQEAGIASNFVQDNEARSNYGVLRGLHYQTGEAAQAKLVRVLEGEVLDVAVDIRPGSSTFGHHVAVKLSATNRRQLYVPRGFAHGYAVLSEVACFFYKCDNYYAPETEGGIIYNDPALRINWQIPDGETVLSEKDLALPTLTHAKPAL